MNTSPNPNQTPPPKRKPHLRVVADGETAPVDTAPAVAKQEKKKKPNYPLRQAVAGAITALLLVSGAKGVEATVDYFTETPKSEEPASAFPSAEEAAEHPELYEKYVAKPGDTLFGIATELNTDDHEIRNDVDKLVDQMGGADVDAGEIVFVPKQPVEEQGK